MSWIICSANQWTDFYIIGTSVMKELNSSQLTITTSEMSIDVVLMSSLSTHFGPVLNFIWKQVIWFKLHSFNMKCNNGLKRVDFKHICNSFLSILWTFTSLLYVVHQLHTSFEWHWKTSAWARFKYTELRSTCSNYC